MISEEVYQIGFVLLLSQNSLIHSANTRLDKVVKDLFPGYYYPNFETLWQEATIVFDTNVLVNLYRYPIAARNDLLTVMERLSNRIWLPYHVGLEFQRQRVNVIYEQIARYQDVSDIIDVNIKKLHNDLNKLQLQKRHSTISVVPLLEGIEKQKTDYLTSLDSLRSQQTLSVESDPIRDSLDKLFRGRIGPAPSSQEILDKIYEEGEKRFSNSIPPGYLDNDKESASKEATYSYGNLQYRKKFGDLIIWMQLIEYARAQKIKSLIFVTDEEYDDWWHIVESKGRKTIGPRPELVHELSIAAGITDFHMYNSERFLSRALAFLKIPNKEQSIEQVIDVKRVSSSKVFKSHSLRLDIAVQEWIKKTFGDYPMDSDYPFPDYILWQDEDTAIGIEVIRRDGVRSTFSAIESKFTSHRDEFSEVGYAQFIFLLIFDNETSAMSFKSTLLRKRPVLPDNFNLIVTFEDESDGVIHLKEPS